MYHELKLKEVRVWKHKKSGHLYWVVGISTCSTNGEQNGKKSVVYQNGYGEMFNRELDEFLDGRFVPMYNV